MQSEKIIKIFNMRAVILVFILLVTPFNTWAADADTERAEIAFLRGEVLSSEDNTPVQFASVFVDGENQYGTTTDVNGRFKIRIPSGEQRVVVRYIGYDDYIFNISNIAHRGRGRDIIADIKLTPTATDIAAVTIEAKTQARQLQEQGFAMNSIDMQSAILSTISTDELINRTAGVKIRQEGGIGSDMEYSINGLSGSSVRVYIDGIPIRNYGPNFTVSSISPALIERIDVYKGVIPAFLADDALGGAINVILKESSINMLNASYSYGSYNTHRAEISGQWRNPKTGFTAGASAYYTYSDNNYEVWGEDVIYVTDTENDFAQYDIRAERFHDSYESFGASANVGFTHVKWADKLKADFLFSGINKDVQHGASMEVVYGERRTKQQSYVANINYEKQNILPRLDVKALASYSYTNRLLIDTCTYVYGWHGDVYMRNGEPLKWNKGGGEGGAASLESNMEHNIVTRVNLDYALDKAENHKISFNAMYTNFMRNVEDPYLSALEQMLTETRIINKLTSSVSYDAKFFDSKLRSSLFYKLFKQSATLVDPIVVSGVTISQEYSNDIINGGYGAVLSYAITPKIFVTLSGEKAIRLPSFTELLGDVSNSVEASMNLEPEKSTNFNIGTMVGPLSFGRNDISITTNLFYRDVTDLIERDVVDTNDDTYGYVNVGQVLSKGVDAQVSYNYRGKRSEMYISANAAYADARFNQQYDDAGLEIAHYNCRMRNQPYLTAGGEVTYRIHRIFSGKGSLALSYYTNYTHEFYVNWEVYGAANKAFVPTQFTHDIGAVYTSPSHKYALSVDVKNLTDEQVFDNYALQKPGRWISAKFSYRLF